MGQAIIPVAREFLEAFLRGEGNPRIQKVDGLPKTFEITGALVQSCGVVQLAIESDEIAEGCAEIIPVYRATGDVAVVAGEIYDLVRRPRKET